MLHVFRKYERYIFIFITVVIVISFSFFGSYSAIQSNAYEDPVVFTAVDGSRITRSELERMNLFIGTDIDEKRNFGGVVGPNFMNDGVLKRDFFETGIAQQIMEGNREAIRGDIELRHGKERLFTPYVHPQAGFIGVEAAWNYFVPGMGAGYAALKGAQDPLSSEALDARVKLYLGEQRLPAPMVRNLLKMQERQYGFVERDPSLDNADLSLFGYHTAEDWFGPHFTRLASEFIINSAMIAKERGYSVSEAEAYADLIRNATRSFTENQKSPYLNARNVGQYIDEQLMRMGLDKVQAVRVWQQVLLFRRLFHDMGNSVFTDRLTFEQYNDYAYESVKGELYRLPESLRLSSGEELGNFETYLESVSSVKKGKERFLLPTVFKKPSEIAKATPELMQKRYLLDISTVTSRELEAKVSVRGMWEWEVDEKNWKLLTEEFPELALAVAKSVSERQNALDKLDQATRSRVDTFARAEIVKAHPEWVVEALDEKKPETKLLRIPLKGGTIAIAGVKEREKLLGYLDKAPLAKEDPSLLEELKQFTADNEHYYRISVIDRSSSPEVMTYAEAKESGVLGELSGKKLKAYYEKEREKSPSEYKNGDGGWKSFDSVAGTVAAKMYDPLVKEMSERFVGGLLPKDEAKNLTMSRAASLRFLQQVADAKASLAAEESDEAAIVHAEVTGDEGSKIAPAKNLADQWRLVKEPYSTSRSRGEALLDKEETLAMAEGEWSKVYTPTNGDLYFFKAESRGSDVGEDRLMRQVLTMHKLLGNDAERSLAKELIALMEKKGALNVSYLDSRRGGGDEDEGESYGEEHDD